MPGISRSGCLPYNGLSSLTLMSSNAKLAPRGLQSIPNTSNDATTATPEIDHDHVPILS